MRSSKEYIFLLIPLSEKWIAWFSLKRFPLGQNCGFAFIAKSWTLSCLCRDTVSVRVLQKNRTKKMCIYTHVYRQREWRRLYVYQSVCLSSISERERLRSWQLWGLVSLKSVGQVDRWETQVGFLRCRLEAELLLLKTSVFALKAFHWLDEVHSHSGGISPLFKIYELWILIASKKVFTTTTKLQRGQVVT